MQNKKLFDGTFLWGVLILSAVSAIAYLPLAHKIGYLNDDWYLIYDMQVKGADFFHVIFSKDRPGRALSMIPLFSMFGFEPFYYHLSAYLFRFLGGVCLYWTLQMLWPRRHFFTLSAAILFTIYPGFLSQTNAIDYQSHMLGLFLSLLSVALSIKSVLTLGKTPRLLLISASILTGWGYLSQMEYFIGMEVFRFAAIFLLFWRTKNESAKQKFTKAILASLPFLLIAGGFLTWRLFFFVSERKATDIGLQISQASSPLTLLWWLNYLIQDILNVVLTSWGLPLYILAFSLRLRESMAAFGWAGFAILITLLGMRRVEKDRTEPETGSRLSQEALWLSLTSIAGGLLPIILVNRHIMLPEYSRYSLIASVGAVLLLAVVIESISSRIGRSTVFVFFVAVAILTHYGNAVKAADETQATRNFWWQAAWRAPQIKEGTTLLASYPGSPLSEDYFIWGPANLIYYPEPQNGTQVRVKLPAAVLADNNVLMKTITNGSSETPMRRGNFLERDFGNVLVMTQASSNGCVRFIDGNAPELSPADQQRLFLVAPYSNLGNVITDGELKTPPAIIFEEEPVHGWCYFYQKADLARQRAEWEQIPVLLNEALDNGYYPEDPLEWMPFLQASTVLGDADQVHKMAKLIATDKFLLMQACKIMTEFIKNETLSDEMTLAIKMNICK